MTQQCWLANTVPVPVLVLCCCPQLHPAGEGWPHLPSSPGGWVGIDPPGWRYHHNLHSHLPRLFPPCINIMSPSSSMLQDFINNDQHHSIGNQKRKLKIHSSHSFRQNKQAEQENQENRICCYQFPIFWDGRHCLTNMLPTVTCTWLCCLVWCWRACLRWSVRPSLKLAFIGWLEAKPQHLAVALETILAQDNTRHRGWNCEFH